MNKGFTKQEAYENIKKIKEAGFEWDALLMVGIAGKGKRDINVSETAELLNTYPPYMVSVMTTAVTAGSELEAYKERGEFLESTELENLEEEKELLRLLEFDDAYFFGSHNYNLIPISGPLSKKEEIIEYLDRRIEEIDDDILNMVKPRASI